MTSRSWSFAPSSRTSRSAALLLLTLLSVPTQGQSPLPDDFNPGVNGRVNALAQQADGKILVGGTFSELGGTPRNNIGRLNPDGTLDERFDPVAGGTISALVVERNGNILVGGSFSSLAGQPRASLARIKPDGTLETQFAAEVDGKVNAMVLTTDDRILVAGEFRSLSGQACANLVRISWDGSLDAGFQPTTDGPVNTLAIQEDGAIVLGGDFLSVAGQARTRLARLNPDGSLDLGFAPNADGSVLCLTSQADRTILVGGTFTRVDGIARNALARLNANGALDMDFEPRAEGVIESVVVQADHKIIVAGESLTGLGGATRLRIGRLQRDGSLDPGFSPGLAGWSVRTAALCLQTDGKLVVAGGFSSIANQGRNGIARLNALEPASQSMVSDQLTLLWLRGGSSPEVWSAAMDLHPPIMIDWLPIAEGTRILGGWEFTQTFGSLEELYATGHSVRLRGRVGGGTRNASAWAVHSYAGPPVLIAEPESLTTDFGKPAAFKALGGGTEPIHYQWFKDGVPLLNGGGLAGVETSVLRLTEALPHHAGSYTMLASNRWGTVTSLAATLSLRDPVITKQPVSLSKETGQNASFSVTTAGSIPLHYQWWKDNLALHGANADSLLLTNVQISDAGCYQVVVSNLAGIATSTQATLTVNGAAADPIFRPEGRATSLAVLADGKVLVGGAQNLAGQQVHGLGQLNADGSLARACDLGANETVASLGLQADTKALVGLHATSGQRNPRIARLNHHGTWDPDFLAGPWNGSQDSVGPLLVQGDGSLLALGTFTLAPGQASKSIIRLNRDGTFDSDFTVVVNDRVTAMAPLQNGRLLVGGAFSRLGTEWRWHLGRLRSDGTADGGFDPLNHIEHDVAALAVQPDDKVLVVHGQYPSRITRLNADGTLDGSFAHPTAANGVELITLQADGKILVAGGFQELCGEPRNRIGRLNHDGSLDRTFNPPGMRDSISAMAVQADGKVLVSGAYSFVGIAKRFHIARFHNTEPATQNLSHNGTTIAWLRGGASPEVWRTSFESTTNGWDWRELGSGERIAGGWRLGGLALPASVPSHK